MLQKLFNNAAANRKAGKISVRSCGLTALTGQPADPAAVELMQERGIDITSHRATPIDIAKINWADLVLVMESWQKDEIQMRVPSSTGKVFRLGHFSDSDIPDPYRAPKDKFAEALRLIEQSVSLWVNETIRSEAASG